MRSEFVRDVEATQGTCAQYTEFWRWDETPQKLTVVDQDQADLLDAELFPRASNALKALRAKLKEDLRDAAPSKVLQSEVVIYLMAAFAGGRILVLIVKPIAQHYGNVMDCSENVGAADRHGLDQEVLQEGAEDSHDRRSQIEP